MSILVGPVTLSATGGTISSITGYRVHTFSTPGTSTFIPRQNGTIEVLVVGGGGDGGPGSGSYGGGGGGGGAVIYNKLANVTSGTPYPITVGAVGSPTGGISSCTFNNATIIAYGGGAGNTPSLNASGGGAYYVNIGGPAGVGAGITGLGFPGGPGSGSSGGGGGGAGGPGGASGVAGIGVSYSITGTSQYYGGGGSTYPQYYAPGLPAPQGIVIIRYPV